LRLHKETSRNHDSIRSGISGTGLQAITRQRAVPPIVGNFASGGSLIDFSL
jgi:ADP-glucose pyrophosphorylase